MYGLVRNSSVIKGNSKEIVNNFILLKIYKFLL